MQATAQLDHIATDPSHSGQQTIVINRAEPIADAIRQKIAEQYCAQLLGSNATDELAPLGETSEMFIRDNDNGYLREYSLVSTEFPLPAISKCVNHDRGCLVLIASSRAIGQLGHPQRTSSY